jgi:alpha-ribazole phosphatase
MPVLIAVRHAPPLVSGMCAGHADIPVEPPEPAARRVCEALSGYDLARIVASPTARANELARELSRRLGAPLRLDDRLRELHFGSWEGRAWSEIEQNEGLALSAWMKQWRTARPPGGESVDELEQRVRCCVEELAAAPTLLVTHAGVIRAGLVITVRLSWPEAMRRAVAYLEPVVLRR